jgi:biopolymer transport protein ExbD
MLGKRRKATEPVEMNMVPIMNLFLAMIPFLLSCAAFFQAAVINASVPALSEGGGPTDEEPKKELDKITLNVQIRKDSFELSAQGDQPPEDLKSLVSSIPMKDREYDYEQLANRCKQIKAKYKKSDTVIILPDKDVLYSVIVKTMDATRDDRILGNRDPQPNYWFTNTVVSSLL